MEDFSLVLPEEKVIREEVAVALTPDESDLMELEMSASEYVKKLMAMPKIGAGLAGGDWEIIERILDDEMRGEYVTVVTWENDVK